MYFKKKHIKFVPIFLVLLALTDLHIEFRLLIDHFTLTSLFFAIKHHPLAIGVLICTPSIYMNYSK